jgi:putative drug exporter of the RND superfamily
MYGLPVTQHLSPGGFYDPDSESAKAAVLIAEKFDRSDTPLIVEITADAGMNSPPAREMAARVAGLFNQSPNVSDVTSAWLTPGAGGLVSNDGKSGLIIAGLRGGEDAAPKHADELATVVRGYLAGLPGVSVRTGGYGMLKAEGTKQTEHDLLRTEMIALPLCFLLLVWIFGGLPAAVVPTAVGLLAIAGSMAILRLFTLLTDVSIFALNLTVALGLALAIDYTLLIISRYRDELADGTDADQALVATMQTAGRTVVFSAVTVALSMAVMVIFPSYFLKSFAYAGVATVVLAAAAAVIATPAAIALLGPRLDSLDLRRPLRRLLRRPEPVRKPVHEVFWYRSTTFIARRGLPIGLAVVALLVFLGAPFLGVKWGYPDDRVLPTTSVTHQLGDRLRSDYPNNLETAVSVVIPDADGVTSAELRRYAADLSRVPDVLAVSTPIGTLADGEVRGPPVAATGMADGSALLTVDTSAPLYSDRSEAQLGRLARRVGPRRPVGPVHRHRDGQPRRRGRDHVPASARVGADRRDHLRAAVRADGQRGAARQGGGAQPAVPDRHLRRPGVDIPGRPSERVRHHTHRHPGRQHPRDGVLHRVRPGHGLRGVPDLADSGVLAGLAGLAGRQRRKRGARAGAHGESHHRGGVADVCLVRGTDRRSGLVHPDVRGGPHPGHHRRRDTGTAGAGAGVHARGRPVELVGAKAFGVAAWANRSE